jgi:hypothetical protein
LGNLGDIRVFHGLRLKLGQQTLHIDHLILHRYGFVLLENIAMMLELQVNTLGEWTHVYCGAPLRIPSPLIQAERKLKKLHSFLEPHASALRSVERAQQLYFYPLAFEKLVVMSGEAKLQLPHGVKVPEFVDEDRLVQRLRSLVAEQSRKARRTLGYKTKGLELSDTELYKISAFLRNQHEPK